MGALLRQDTLTGGLLVIKRPTTRCRPLNVYGVEPQRLFASVGTCRRFVYEAIIYNFCYSWALFWMLLFYVGTEELLKVRPMR